LWFSPAERLFLRFNSYPFFLSARIGPRNEEP
jgi:hypothetical protein